MRHRAKHDLARAQDPGKVSDVFDGKIYRTLKQTKVHEENDYQYFQYDDDIALGLGTDGFTMFKRRQRRGHSTAWPLILVNYNLHPSIRNRLENIICVGVVPGPQECKDINSFLVPLIEELLQLADGVKADKVWNPEDDFEGDGIEFTLHAFLIILFGDIPAIAKLLLLRGHNGVAPCRMCLIQGVPCVLAGNTVRYSPLTPPGEEPFPPGDLPLRTHESFLMSYDDLDAARNDAELDRIAEDCGINGRSVFSRLGSIDLSTCAPYELMHLIFENLVPNMVHHWKGTFKWLDHARDTYKMNGDVWKEIGERTAEATRTIPGQFVGTILDINKDMGIYKGEQYSFWFLYLAPILLNGKLNQEHYQHFLDIREIIFLCLEFELTDAQINDMERRIHEWVVTYERLYYQYEYDRLPCCVITVHALLHLPYQIRRTGPPSTTWSFIMERFCGSLLRPALANRVRPYEYLDNFIRRRAQMQIVSHVHRKPELIRPLANRRIRGGEYISSKEQIYDAAPGYILGQPVQRGYRADEQLKRHMTRYFGVVEGNERLTERELRERIDWDTLVRHGWFRMTSMGDRVRTVDLVETSKVARDNSFIRYELLPDANPNNHRIGYRPRREVFYGCVDDVFYVEYIRDHETNDRVPYLLVRVRECNTGGLDASLPQNPIVTFNRLSSPEIIHIGAVDAAIGRVKVGGRNTWAVIDRTRGARTQFNNDDGNPDPDLE